MLLRPINNSDLTNIISITKRNTRVPAWSLYILEIAIGKLLSRPPLTRKVKNKKYKKITKKGKVTDRKDFI